MCSPGEREYWTVRYGGSVGRLKDAKGLWDLARLLAVPRRGVHSGAVAAADRPAEPPAPPTTQAGAAGPRVPADLGTRESCWTPARRPPTRPAGRTGGRAGGCGALRRPGPRCGGGRGAGPFGGRARAGGRAGRPRPPRTP